MRFKKIELPFKVKYPILSLGSDLKNTVCFAYGKHAFLSKPLGDLSEITNHKLFVNTIVGIPRQFKKRYRVIAYDLHPAYHSSRYISQLAHQDRLLIPVQHHHAHICSCMVENRLKNTEIIGVAFDGTGFGQDSRLWGAEILVCNYMNFKRAAHLKYIQLPGGEMAIREPWRICASWLFLIYKENFLKIKIDFVKKIERRKWLLLRKILEHNFNSPLSSSIGRLFDAVSAMVLGMDKVNYEGQAAIELEREAKKFINQQNLQKKLKGYSYKIIKKKDGYVIDPSLIFKEIVSALTRRQPKGAISFRFHLTLARIVADICLRIRKDTKINKVALSGGVFQNKILLNLILDLLYRRNFEVFYHQDLTCTDANISLGQMAVANFKLCA